MDEGFSAELNAWLDATERAAGEQSESRYEVHRTLAEKPGETTQIVYRRADGEARIGPFVRKILRGSEVDAHGLGGDGRGAAYQHLMAAQMRGVRLVHQPLIYDLTSHAGTLEVVMEYVRGWDLDELVAHEGAGLSLARRIAPALCEAVIELHEMLDAPIIHRDIKPSNVMVADDGRLVLIDLGIARAWREGASRDTVRYGTPGYAPPEQYGYGQTDVRSDVYALGMTIAYCLLGEDPSDVRDASFVDGRVPEQLRPVLVRATKFDPEMRQQSVRVLLEEVLDALGGPVSPGGFASHQPASGSQSVDRPERFVLLGHIWNVLLTAAAMLFSVVCVVAIVSPDSDSIPAGYPAWFRALMFVGMGIVPICSVAYLLFDKRRLRKYPPFAGRTWRQDFVFCVALTVGLFIFTLVLYIIFVSPNMPNAAA